MGDIYILEDLLKTLICLEIKSYHFYEEYKTNSEDSNLKQIFGELALAEKNHEIFYKAFKDRILNSEIALMDEEYKDYITNLINNNFFIKNSDFSAKSVKDILDIAEKLEKDTIFFMNELSEVINEKTYFKVILEEEKKHLLTIYQYKKDHNIT